MENSPDFCRTIEQRRNRPTLPLGDLKASLLSEEP